MQMSYFTIILIQPDNLILQVTITISTISVGMIKERVCCFNPSFNSNTNPAIGSHLISEYMRSILPFGSDGLLKVVPVPGIPPLTSLHHLNLAWGFNMTLDTINSFHSVQGCIHSSKIYISISMNR